MNIKQILIQVDSVYNSNRLSGNKLSKFEALKAMLPEILAEERKELLNSLRMEVESELEQWKGDGIMVRRGEYSQQIKKILLKRINDLKE